MKNKKHKSQKIFHDLKFYTCKSHIKSVSDNEGRVTLGNGLTQLTEIKVLLRFSFSFVLIFRKRIVSHSLT